MRANQIGFLLCRLIAVWIVVWAMPGLVRGLVELLRPDRPMRWSESSGEPWFGLAVIVIGWIVWVLARPLSRFLVEDADGGEKVSVDVAQFAAVGLALIGAFAIINGAAGSTSFLRALWGIDPGLSPYPAWLFGERGLSGPVLTLLGLALVLWAPRLGIWLESTSGNSEEAGSEPT